MVRREMYSIPGIDRSACAWMDITTAGQVKPCYRVKRDSASAKGIPVTSSTSLDDYANTKEPFLPHDVPSHAWHTIIFELIALTLNFQ